MQDLFSEFTYPPAQQAAPVNNSARLHPGMPQSVLPGHAYGQVPSPVPLHPGFPPGMVAFPVQPGMPGAYPQYFMASPPGPTMAASPQGALSAHVQSAGSPLAEGPKAQEEHDAFSGLVPGLLSSLPAVQPAVYKAVQPSSASGYQNTLRPPGFAATESLPSAGHQQAMGNGTGSALQTGAPYYAAGVLPGMYSGSFTDPSHAQQAKRAGGNPFA